MTRPFDFPRLIQSKKTRVVLSLVLLGFLSIRWVFYVTDGHYSHINFLGLARNRKINFHNTPKHLRPSPLSSSWNMDKEMMEFSERRILRPQLTVSSKFLYNPSVVRLSKNEYIFTGRISWQHSADCDRRSNAMDMYYCNHANARQWADSTVIGRYSKGQSTVVLDGDITNTDEKGNSLTSLGKINEWYDGAGWYDTKLVSPLAISDSSQDIIFLTAQKNEILNSKNWIEIEAGAIILLQMSHIAYFDKSRPDKNIKFARAIYHDESPPDWTAPIVSKYIGKYKIKMTTVGAAMCKPRSSDLPQLPYNFEALQADVLPVEMNETNLSLGGGGRNTEDGIVIGTGLNMTQLGLEEIAHNQPRRRLAAVVGKGFLGAIKDKNWSPFIVGSEKQILWSYLLEPHIVCQNDVDLTKYDVDCVLCKRKYATRSSIFQLTSTRLIAEDKIRYLRSPNIKEHSHEVQYHLNGVPAFLIDSSSSSITSTTNSFYLGVAHYIIGKMSRNIITGEEDYVKKYVHFFYRISALPPYEVLDISEHIPLKTERSIACWFKPFEVVDVAFVNGFEYLPDEGGVKGGEFLLSYGVGDRESWTLTMTLQEIMALFV